MKLFTFALALLFSLNSYGAQMNWSDLEGCYESVLIDGKPVEMGPDLQKSLTEIKSGESSVFENLDHSPLNHILLILFTGASGPWYSYHSFVAFPQHGDLSTTRDQLNYTVDADFFLNDRGFRKKVDHYLSIELEQDGEYLTGSASFESHIRNMSGERTFKLKRTTCF